MSSRGRSSHQQGIIRRYYEHFDTIALQKLGELISELYLADGGKAAKLWERARAALGKVAAEDPRVARILATRNIEELARLVNELNAGANQSAPPTPDSSPPSDQPSLTQRPAPAESVARATSPASPAAPTPEQLKAAMKAFRKRLKLTILNDESRLNSRNPMSSGRRSEVVAIMPPREYPRAVWDELVRQGKLRSSGGSFYELAEG